jgi:hypothetical protein
MARLVSRYSAQEMTWKCEMFFPEERRSEFTHLSWDGVSFRHYRDPKITCIEYFRQRDQLAVQHRADDADVIPIGRALRRRKQL